MGKRLLRAASVVILATIALAGGCGGGGNGAAPANVGGLWEGTLELGFGPGGSGGSVAAPFELRLTQDGDFAVGIATWTALGEPQSAALTLDGNDVSLRLAFWCESRNGGVVLTGSVDGDIMRLTEGEGIACFDRGADNDVSRVSGALLRDTTGTPIPKRAD